MSATVTDFGLLDLATEETWFNRERVEAARRAYLTFHLGDEVYGLELLRLREIIKARPPTEVPRAPPYIAGVVSVRGLVMPVVDLRARLRMPAGDKAPTRCLVVARGEERYALLVDDVNNVVGFTDDEIEAAPAMLGRSADGEGGRGVEYIAGIGRAADNPEQLVILLDLDAVLRFEDLRPRRGGHGGGQ